MASTAATQTPQVAQARSAAYTLIASGFQHPDGALIEVLADPEQWRDWPQVLKAIDRRIDEPLQAVRKAAHSEAQVVLNCSDDEPYKLQYRYDGIFGHAVRGKCSAYEMGYCHHDIIRQASDLADVNGFYGAFGL